MCYVNHTTKILVRFFMQLSQKGYNNAKPTRFKTTTQRLNVKCCPLQIKWSRGHKRCLSQRLKDHIYPMLYNQLLSILTFRSLKLHSNWTSYDNTQIHVNKKNSSFIAKVVTKISLCGWSSICNIKGHSRHAQISDLRI